MVQGNSIRRGAVLLLAASFCACRVPRRGPADHSPAASSEVASIQPTEDPHAGGIAGTSPGTSTQDGAGSTAKSKSPFHGYVATRYRVRTTTGEDDHDLDTLLGLDFGDASKDRVSAHAMARLSADPGGTSPSDPFFGLDDTFEDSLTARLYYAWIDYRPTTPKPGRIERWRLGRQIDYFTPEVAWFDGLSAQTRARGEQQLQLGLYGGLPVQLYESRTDAGSMLGAFLQGQPFKQTRVRADWMHLEDETRLADNQDDLLSLGVWQSVSPRLRLEGKYTHLEQEPRDARVQASWYDDRNDLTLFLSYYELLHTQQSLAFELDPFFTTLLEQFPYRQLRLLGTKAFGESLLFQGGADVRRVSDDSDIGQFNRDFERTFLTATLADALPWQLTASLTGEIWNSPQSDIETWGADLSRRFGKTIEASLGSYYALFKYDFQASVERDDVRTYFLGLRWKQKGARAFDLRYEFEDSEFGDFQTLRLGAQWHF